jgi:hypothetical protein
MFTKKKNRGDEKTKTEPFSTRHMSLDELRAYRKTIVDKSSTKIKPVDTEESGDAGDEDDD